VGKTSNSRGQIGETVRDQQHQGDGIVAGIGSATQTLRLDAVEETQARMLRVLLDLADAVKQINTRLVAASAVLGVQRCELVVEAQDDLTSCSIEGRVCRDVLADRLGFLDVPASA
jgi:hypothetical protein